MEMTDRYAVQEYDCAGHYFEIGAYSDIGTRNYQEDSLLVAERDDTLLIAVCDGMGGTNGGALASQAAVDLLYELFMQEDVSSPSSFYSGCVDRLDAKVYFLEDESKRRLQAGTTIVSVIVRGNQLDWLSIGDSRVYIFRRGEIVQISKDHNYKEELLELLAENRITQEQYQAEESKHMALTSYLGIGGVKLMDTSEEPLYLQTGDLVVLTTDGLYNAISVSEIAQYTENSVKLIMEKIAQLIDESKIPSRDNTSFIVLKYGGYHPQSEI